MNDTQTEMRRLLAAATEDMPPGIDLLDGFSVARRRERARRKRRRAVLSAGFAMVAASVTAVMLTVGSAPPALATVTTALTRTLSQSYHLTEQDSEFAMWPIPGAYHSYHDTCVSVADPVRHLWEFSCPGFEQREVGGFTYSHISLGHHPPGKTWARVPGEDSSGLALLPGDPPFTFATPQQMLSVIEKVVKVTVAGPASGPGWTGTRYAFSGRADPLDTVSGTLDVDRQGRARVLVIRTPRPGAVFNVTGVTQVLTFSDFGARVTVTPPPADQTYTQH